MGLILGSRRVVCFGWTRAGRWHTRGEKGGKAGGTQEVRREKGEQAGGTQEVRREKGGIFTVS